jgi:ribosome biogenesis GTPase / thiamine phosphate phosphatase
LVSRALKLRSAASRDEVNPDAERRKKSAKSWRNLLDDDSPAFERSRPRARRSVKDLMIKLIDEEALPARSGGNDRPGETEAKVGSDHPPDEEGVCAGADDSRALIQGTVLSTSAGTCVVASGDGEVRCILSKEIAAAQKSSLAVGDEVAYGLRADGGGVVDAVLPRRTILSRPDPLLSERERVIACNIDAVVIVCSVKSPPLRIRLIDRFLIAVERGGAEPILCVNKIDLPGSEDELARELAGLAPYRAIGIPIVLTSAEARTGLDELRRAIGGRRCAFVGHSGVGKSSLLNAMDPALDLTTKRISENSNRGTHSTTASTLYRIPGGGEVIDTPGIRQFGLWDMRRTDLRWYFPEFVGHAEACRFRNCTHTSEPECGVKRAVTTGMIPTARYDTYRRILDTLAE